MSAIHIEPLDDAPAYRRPARLLHWVMAAIVICLIPAGILMANTDLGAWGDTVFNLHRSFGFVVLVLALIRFGYRLTHEPKPLPDHMPFIQKLAAETTHWALYALMITTPFVGWIATNAYGAPISVFGLFELPALVGKDEALSKTLFGIHRFAGIAFALGILAHIGAALFHAFIQKDGLLKRMWPI